MNAFRLALCALILVGVAQARPIVTEEIATLTPPDASWEYIGRFGVAIDGDYALVSAERFVPDPNTETGTRHDGAALLYMRSGNAWNYVGLLGPVQEITEWVKPGLAMNGGIAATIIGVNARVFERTGATWAFTSYLDYALQGPDIEIDGGRILVPRISCSNQSIVARKIDGIWRVEGELAGHSSECGDNPPSPLQDLQGERAVIFNEAGQDFEPPTARLYRKNASGSGWQPLVDLVYHADDYLFGPDVAISGRFVIVTGSRERGTNILHEVNQTWGGNFFNTLQPADGYLQPELTSGTSLKRVGELFAQRNYSYDRDSYVVNIFRVNTDLYYSATHVATLQAKLGGSLGGPIGVSGNRIIVSGRVNFGGDNTVRIFELPATFEHTAVQVNEFESETEAAPWTRLPGSAFSVVTVSPSRVWRQSNTAGTAGAFLPTSLSRDHSIQGEVTVRSFAGADRWVGLTTRRSDDSNYYYVTLRSSGSVQLRRMLNGTFTTLASAPAAVVTGRRYRLRLESIGTVHRVYLDDRQVLTAYDSTLTEGTAGLAMYRTAADFDNVIVSPSPFTSIYATDFSGENPGPANWRNLGDWQDVGGVYRQGSTSGSARSVIGPLTDDQIVQVRVRPLSFDGADRWVGVLARYYDDNNYLYVTLRSSNRIALRRLINGQITEIASGLMTVTPGTWYTIRIEVVNNLIRVFVNDNLTFLTPAAPGPAGPNPGGNKGRVGLVTYRATAEYDDFLAYQP